MPDISLGCCIDGESCWWYVHHVGGDDIDDLSELTFPHALGTGLRNPDDRHHVVVEGLGEVVWGCFVEVDTLCATGIGIVDEHIDLFICQALHKQAHTRLVGEIYLNSPDVGVFASQCPGFILMTAIGKQHLMLCQGSTRFYQCLPQTRGSSCDDNVHALFV